jgi:hypothetical protein
MKNNETLIAQAKKAARRASRSQSKSYQSCLDDVARAAGKEHWSAFLSDPVDITSGSSSDTPKPVEPQPTPMDFRFQADEEAGRSTPPVEVGHPISMIGRLRTSIGGRILRGLGLDAESDLIRQAVKRRIIAGIGAKSGYVGHPTLGATVSGTPVAMAELVPVLAIAPPGTGKSAGVVIPAILTAEEISLVVHDEWDLHVITSGRRAQLGPVTVLNLGSARSRGSLNPLSRSWLPTDPAARSGYVNRLAEALSPEDPLASSLLSEAIMERIGEAGESSFTEVARHLRLRKLDPVLHSSLAAIGPMLDPGVVECTEDDVYRPSELRRGRTDEGELSVGTLYIVRSREDGHRQARAAAVLQAAIWYHCLSHGPGEIGFDGGRVGFRGILVVMDGAHHLPIMPMLATALDTGRSKKLGHMIIGPSHGSIRRIFDQTMRDEFTSLVGLEIVLGQNNLEDAERIARRYPELSIGEIMSPRRGCHLLLVQNLAGPVRMRTPLFFESQALLSLSYNPRTHKGPRPVCG